MYICRRRESLARGVCGSVLCCCIRRFSYVPECVRRDQHHSRGFLLAFRQRIFCGTFSTLGIVFHISGSQNGCYNIACTGGTSNSAFKRCCKGRKSAIAKKVLVEEHAIFLPLFMTEGDIFDFSNPVYIPMESRRYLSCLLYTSPSPRDQRGSRMPSSA